MISFIQNTNTSLSSNSCYISCLKLNMKMYKHYGTEVE